MPEQLIYSDFFYLYLNAGPRATPNWVGSASGTGLRDPESQDPEPGRRDPGSRRPVPDPETLPFVMGLVFFLFVFLCAMSAVQY